MGEKGRCSVKAQALLGGRQEEGGAGRGTVLLPGWRERENFLCIARC